MISLTKQRVYFNNETKKLETLTKYNFELKDIDPTMRDSLSSLTNISKDIDKILRSDNEIFEEEFEEQKPFHKCLSH